MPSDHCKLINSLFPGGGGGGGGGIQTSFNITLGILEGFVDGK